MKCRLLAALALGLVSCGNDTIPDEPLYQEQWAIHYDRPFYEAYGINPDAHIHGQKTMQQYTGKGVKVAVIDIGLDVNHPEIRHNIVKALNSRDGSNHVACTNSSTCFHGTAITGVIASNINGEGLRGIAPDVDIVFIQLDLNGFLSNSEILAALNYAEAENVDIVNCSWGTGNVAPVVQAKIDQMATTGRNGKGIIFVFASGNNGKLVTNDESMLDSVVGVGSTDEENLRAIYSNFGAGLDIVAPGGYVLGITTTYESNHVSHPSLYMRAEDYDKFQGTSASVPIVVGSIALLLEANPLLTRVQVQDMIRKSADKIGNVPYTAGYNHYYGYGKLNLDTAFSLLTNH